MATSFQRVEFGIGGTIREDEIGVNYVGEPYNEAEPDVQSFADKLLLSHPTLRLTELQKNISNDEIVGHSAKYLIDYHPGSKSLHNIIRDIRLKRNIGVALAKFLCTDLSITDRSNGLMEFFKDYGSDWQAPVIRRHLWGAINPPRATLTSPTFLTTSLRQTSSLMFEKIERLFDYTLKSNDKNNVSSTCWLYHLIVSSILIDPENGNDIIDDLKNQCAKIKAPWILDRIIKRGEHLLNQPNRKEEFIGWLIDRVKKCDSEGFKFAIYAMVYYGATTKRNPNFSSEYLLSDGQLIPSADVLDFKKVVSECYENMKEPRYHSILDREINALRLLLMMKVMLKFFKADFLQNPQQNEMIQQLMRNVCNDYSHFNNFTFQEAEGMILKAEGLHFAKS